MSNWLHAATHAAHHEKHNPKLAAVMWIIIGFFLAPMLVGLPMIGYGVYKLAN